ncbi:hypothetical protein HS7_19250 [Sulfolobales archaeon HS-7]|nr:hypothetical protein HS7_19250 [Sulfolobales archaeon HS-7]
MDIEIELIRKLETLALLKLSEEEENNIINDIKKILDFFNTIQKAQLSDVEPLFHPIKSTHLRPDEVKNGLTKEEALANASSVEGGYIRGPRTGE